MTKEKKQKPQFQSEQLSRTADIKGVFNKSGSPNCSHKVFVITPLNHNTIHSNRNESFPERYNPILLRSTSLTLDESKQVMKEFN